MLKDRIFILVCTLILFLVTRQDVIKIPIIKKTEIWKPPHIVHFLRDDEEVTYEWEMNAINAEVYYGQVAIGSNKQILTLKIDIGNPVSWVATELCDVCKARTKFYTNESTSFRRANHISLPNRAGAILDGYLSNDYMRLDSYEHSIPSVKSQCFVALTYDGTPDVTIDGVLGVSWTTHIQDYNCDNYFENLYASDKNIDSRTFGLSLSPSAAHISLGGYDKVLVNSNDDISWIQHASNDFGYSVRVKGVGLRGGKDKKNDPRATKEDIFNATLTTGTGHLKIPEDDFIELATEVPIKDPRQDCTLSTQGVVTCSIEPDLKLDDFPDIWIEFEANDTSSIFAKIRPIDYVKLQEHGESDIAVFLLEIRNSSDGFGNSSWVLGTSFLRNYYSIFHLDKDSPIGLSTLSGDYPLMTEWFTNSGNNSENWKIVGITMGAIAGLCVLCVICLMIARKNASGADEPQVIDEHPIYAPKEQFVISKASDYE